LAISSVEAGPAAAARVLSALVGLRDRYAPGVGVVPWRSLSIVVVGCGFAYGAVMGGWGQRPLQSFYSGLKVPLLIAISTVVCLPNFFVINSLLGLRDDFSAACRGILVGQAVLATSLASLAPITAFLYVSGVRYSTAIVVNGVAFLVAAGAAQVAVAAHYRPLIARRPAHRTALGAWLALYLFVAIQCAWVLRPYVGAPSMRVVFFRPNAWSNAYLVVIDDVVRQFTGR
jgi:hypothetical protein